MKKLRENIILALFIITTILLTSIQYASAYDNSTLKLYFTMGDGVSTTIYDSVNGVVLKKTSGANFIDGVDSDCLIGSCLFGGSDGIFRNYTMGIEPYDNTDWSINFWLKDLNGYGGGINTMNLYASPYYTYPYVTANTTTLKDLRLGRSIGTTYQFNSSNQTQNIPISQWNMFTITFDTETSIYYGYINGNYLGYYDIADDYTYGYNGFSITFAEYTYYDEVSVFYQILNLTDVQTLYNNGNGLSYAQTLASGSGFVNATSNTTSNTTSNFTGFYHDYCWFNVACQNYNVSSQLCDDDVFKVCIVNDTTYGCADTFDTYAGIGLENQTASFSATCYNNAYYYQYPSYVGGGSIIYDVCYDGHYYCHTYNITSNTCLAYINNTKNFVDCGQYYNGNYVGGTCVDTIAQYVNAGTYAPNNNYSASCVGLSSECSTIGSTTCLNTSSVGTCYQLSSNTSILKYFKTSDCNSYQYCNALLGKCTNLNNVVTGDTNGDGIIDNNDSFDLSNNKTLLAFIIIMISAIVIGGLCSLSGNGLVIGIGALAGIIVGVIIAVALGYLNIIYAILIGVVDAGLIVLLFKAVFGNNN